MYLQNVALLACELVEGADVAAGHELVGQVRLAHLGGAEHEHGVPGKEIGLIDGLCINIIYCFLVPTLEYRWSCSSSSWRRRRLCSTGGWSGQNARNG